MKNSRKAFTMIELIFVIVIIGILTAVAIPKLVATRDDAKVSTSLSDLALLVREMGGYYTAHDKYDTGNDKITDLTNIKLFTNTDCSTIAREIVSGNSYYYCTNDGSSLEACVKIIPNNAGGLVVFSGENTPSGDICKGIQLAPQFVKNISRSFKMGGVRIY